MCLSIRQLWVVFELSDGKFGQIIVWRQGRVPRADNGNATDAGIDGGDDLLHVVAQKQPTFGDDLRKTGQNGSVTVCLHLGPRIDSVEPARYEMCQIRRIGIGMGKEQLLGRNRTR